MLEPFSCVSVFIYISSSFLFSQAFTSNVLAIKEAPRCHILLIYKSFLDFSLCFFYRKRCLLVCIVEALAAIIMDEALCYLNGI